MCCDTWILAENHDMPSMYFFFLEVSKSVSKIFFMTMKLSLKLYITAIKAKYKTKQYYKKCVTPKTLENKK